MSEKLENCPICGCEPKAARGYSGFDLTKIHVRCVSPDCWLANFMQGTSWFEWPSIEVWNTRHYPPVVQAVLQRACDLIANRGKGTLEYDCYTELEKAVHEYKEMEREK